MPDFHRQFPNDAPTKQFANFREVILYLFSEYERRAVIAQRFKEILVATEPKSVTQLRPGTYTDRSVESPTLMRMLRPSLDRSTKIGDVE
jgi:hypothetical protein